MSSRVVSRGLATLCLGLVACGFDAQPEIEGLTSTAGSLISLRIEGTEVEPIADEEISWDFVDRPPGSNSLLLSQDRYRADFRADRTGLFVVDRWHKSGVSDNWTHRFFIEVNDPAPVATIVGPSSAGPGDSITLDGSGSVGSSLQYRWQLQRVPLGSVAMLTTTTASISGFVADEPGLYTVALDVFDGEQWSEETARLDVTVD